MSSIELMKRPTILDVARASGVAKSTVSVVLNGTPAADRVPEETRQRVRNVAGQLGYRASWRARVLAERKTHMIGIVYARPHRILLRGNYEGILNGIYEVFQARGYHLLMMPLGDNPVDWEKVLLDQRIDGALVLSKVHPVIRKIVADGRMPITLVNGETDFDMPMVMADEMGGARATMEHLLSLGHKRICFLLGQQPEHYSVHQRTSGYKQAMVEAGLESHVKVLDTASALTDFADRFAASSVAERPTAVMCYNHYMAITLLRELWERGVCVPRDISVTGFSNAYPVDEVIPPLTTVALATEQMGRTAAELVLAQIESKERLPATRVVLNTNLIIRKSTAAPPAQPADAGSAGRSVVRPVDGGSPDGRSADGAKISAGRAATRSSKSS